MIANFRDLIVYKKASEHAMKIFHLTKAFPSEYAQIGKMLGSMISASEKFCYNSKK